MMVVRELSGDERGLGFFFFFSKGFRVYRFVFGVYRLQDKQRETMNQRAFEGFLSSFNFFFFFFSCIIP